MNKTGQQQIRIGIDGRPLQGRRRGDGRYVFEFCRQLDELMIDGQFFVYSSIPVEMPVDSERWVLRSERGAMSRLPPFFWMKTRGAQLARKDNLNVFWGTNAFLPTLGAGVRTILTVHDLCHVVIPQTYRFRDYWVNRLFVKRDILRATEVMTVSAATARRIRSFANRESTPVKINAAAHFRPPPENVITGTLRKHGISSPYLLAMGVWEPRKNLESLVEAFLRMKERGELPQHALVLAGKKGWKCKKLEQRVRSDKGNNVLWLGYVPDEDLPSLYTGAELFVFPSLYEGFGIPLLEARACGTRVLTSDTPETREAGGPDALYVTPTIVGLCEGIRASLKTERPKALAAAPSNEAAILARLLIGETVPP